MAVEAYWRPPCSHHSLARSLGVSRQGTEHGAWSNEQRERESVFEACARSSSSQWGAGSGEEGGECPSGMLGRPTRTEDEADRLKRKEARREHLDSWFRGFDRHFESSVSTKLRREVGVCDESGPVGGEGRALQLHSPQGPCPCPEVAAVTAQRLHARRTATSTAHILVRHQSHSPAPEASKRTLPRPLLGKARASPPSFCLAERHHGPSLKHVA